MASMKKMKPNPKEKRKQDQKQNQGTICTTATIIHLLQNLQQQHVWDSPTKHIIPSLQVICLGQHTLHSYGNQCLLQPSKPITICVQCKWKLQDLELSMLDSLRRERERERAPLH
jgi:hypothetical protein